jgi:hypothetical protein
MPKITFYLFFPSEGTGGVERLFYLMYLELKDQFDVILIGEKNSIYSKWGVPDSGICTKWEFQKFVKEGGKEIKSIVFVPFPLLYDPETAKLIEGAYPIFWALHPGLVTGRFYSEQVYKLPVWLQNFYLNIRYYYQLSSLKHLLIQYHKSNQLWWMDKACFENANILLKLKISPRLVHAFLPRIERISLVNSKPIEGFKKDHLNISSILRPVNIKFNPIVKLIKDINRNYSGLHLRIHLIGNPIQLKQLTDRNQLFFEGNNSIQFIFPGEMEEKDLLKYLKYNVDVNFSMGMSVLESARLEIASVLINPIQDSYFNYILKKNISYLFLHELKDDSLGSPIISPNPQFNFKIFFEKILDTESLKIIAKKDKDKFESVFSEKSFLYNIQNVFDCSEKLNNLTLFNADQIKKNLNRK